jgi:hypothetical protein
VFTLLFVVVMPLINFHTRVGGEANRVLSLLFLRFWLFGIYVNCFESTLLTGAIRSGSASWRNFLARYRVRP